MATKIDLLRQAEFTSSGSSFSVNSNTLTNLVDPSSQQDAATKAYVDSVSAGLDPKESVRVATTTNGALATAYENGDTIDGVVLATGDRILIKDQTDASENGIYTVNASGAPTRTTDFDGTPTNEVDGGEYVFVIEGTDNNGQGFVVINADANFTGTGGYCVVGTDNIEFTQFSGAGSVPEATEGAGGGTKGIVTVNSNDSGLTITSGSIAVDHASSNPGLAITSGDLELDLNSVAAGAIVASTDSIVFIDADDSNSNKQESVADFMTAVAGVGLVQSSGQLALDLNELTDATMSVANDSIVFIDADDSNASRKESFSDVVGNMTGDGLSSTGGVLSVNYQAGNPSAVDDAADTITLLPSAGTIVDGSELVFVRGQLVDSTNYSVNTSTGVFTFTGFDITSDDATTDFYVWYLRT